MEGTDCQVWTAVAGLGGRAIVGKTISGIVKAALEGKFKDEMTWFDIDSSVLNSYTKDGEGVTFPEGPLADSQLMDSVK